MEFSKRYHKMKTIGTGGMAKVYLANDNVTGQKVAVKMLDPDIGKSLVYRKRFLSEIKLLQRIDSPFVVKPIDLEWGDDGQFYVMEYVAGVNLRDYVHKHGPLDMQTALRFGAHITLGLAAMHHCGIVHRDIKPQNIMIDQRNMAKIIDFGIARDNETEDLTRTGVIIGSIQYVAPEIVVGNAPSVQSDIYALGIVLYFMMKGDVPYDATDESVIAAMHRQGQMAEIDTLPPLMRLIIKNLTARKPEQRPKNMLHVFRMLDKARKQSLEN